LSCGRCESTATEFGKDPRRTFHIHNRDNAPHDSIDRHLRVQIDQGILNVLKMVLFILVEAEENALDIDSGTSDDRTQTASKEQGGQVRWFD
jgi:hypothetical protein